eukprot:705726-Rhodomonas_salina.1
MGGRSRPRVFFMSRYMPLTAAPALLSAPSTPIMCRDAHVLRKMVGSTHPRMQRQCRAQRAPPSAHPRSCMGARARAMD